MINLCYRVHRRDETYLCRESLVGQGANGMKKERRVPKQPLGKWFKTGKEGRLQE